MLRLAAIPPNGKARPSVHYDRHCARAKRQLCRAGRAFVERLVLEVETDSGLATEPLTISSRGISISEYWLPHDSPAACGLLHLCG